MENNFFVKGWRGNLTCWKQGMRGFQFLMLP